MLVRPIRLGGEGRISIGDHVYIGSGSWLQTQQNDENDAIAISIGSGTSIAGGVVISAIESVVLERDVLIARNVYISDHMHKYTETALPVMNQGLDRIRPVLVKCGAWLCQNVVICPGVTIGEGSVVGANSVVTESIPNFCVAAGAPARVVRRTESLTQ